MIVKNENVKDKRTAIINREFNSIDCSKASFKPRKLAPANAGIDNKKEILFINLRKYLIVKNENINDKKVAINNK